MYLESYSAAEPLDHAPAFRVDAYSAVLSAVPVVRKTLPVAYVLNRAVGVVAVLLRSVEYRNYSRKACRIAPVGHVAGVGADFVVAGTEHFFQLDFSVCLSVNDGALARGDDVAARIEQFHVEDTAYVCE